MYIFYWNSQNSRSYRKNEVSKNRSILNPGKGQTRNIIGEFQHPGVQHWDSVLENSSATERTYTVTTVLKRISSERGEQAHKARSNYYDIVLAKYEMNTLTDQDRGFSSSNPV